MHKKLLFIALTWLCAISSMADTLTILNRFEKIEHASVLASYRNEFGSYCKPNLDVEFPYALIRVHIDGNKEAVTQAKELFALYLGQHYTTKAKNTSRVNEIMFLVPVGAGHVELQCGDGCQPLVLFDYTQLAADAIYEGKVRYALEKQEPVQSTTTQAPKRQFFKFRVTPKKDAWVTVWENGEQQTLTLDEEGMTRKMFNYGTYRYMVSADRYHSQEGMFTVSKTPGELAVTLQPQFGWLTIEGDAVANGAHVFATNTATGRKTQLGTIPLTDREIDEGVYALQIQQSKYKDYSTTVTISEGKTTVIRPQLEANFAELTLTTQSGADIYVDGHKLGTGRWSGTLELGEYSVETRQASHKSSYTNLAVSLQTAGQTIELNDPLPIYGSLIVDGTPMDVAVYVDNKKVGVSPLVYSEILIGEHKVRLEKEGYAKQEKTVQIAEGQEHMLDYTLAKETPKAAPQPAATSASTGEHEYVDLGLSVKWATCNVGANKPEDYGDYFAWGETEPKRTYKWRTYKWCRGSDESQTKYCTRSRFGTVDNKTVLEAADDAACANWGGSWRMPTKAEQDELREKCTWTWTTQNGVKGYKVTSKRNGNSIFLPAAGYRIGISLCRAGRHADYWSSSLYADYPVTAWVVRISSDIMFGSNSYREYGHSVRPVCP